jgi:glutathione S-transferase
MFVVYLGTKTYSSWSMRGWLAARIALGKDGFEEVKVYLAGDGAPADVYQENRSKLLKISPTGKVPAVLDRELGDVLIHDSFAINLYLADRFPASGLLPSNPVARGLCYSACAEMHSGFQALRANWTFHCVSSARTHGAETFASKPELQAHIDRLKALWTGLRSQFGGDGPFLFGASFSAANCMYAPVALRFRTYDPDLVSFQDAPVAAEYVRNIWENEHVRDWIEDAKLEGPELKIPQYEKHMDKCAVDAAQTGCC